MRDESQPDISLGNILQMNLIELNKADRLGLPEGPLRAWVTFFKHWQEELTMANVAHEPVKKAMSRIRELSADEETRRLAFVRERALRDEVSLLNDARREGREEVARGMIRKTELDDSSIADIAQLTVDEVAHLRAEIQHWDS